MDNLFYTPPNTAQARKQIRKQRENIAKQLEEESILRQKVKRFVLESLGGTPADYVATRVSFLYSNHFRVNVLTNKGSTHTKNADRITHSYFVWLDGEEFKSNPAIDKVYSNLDNG